MAIWVESISLEDLANRSSNTLAEHLGIQFTEIGDDYLKATMPVDKRTKQPLGLLNGGASAALAETVASTAANYCVDHSKQYCVGLAVDAHHLRSARSGLVTGVATPLKIGSRIQVWFVDIFDDNEKQICHAKMTMAVVSR